VNMKPKPRAKVDHHWTRQTVSLRAGQIEFVKVNTDAWKWRDVYRWLLGLSWPQFALFVASLYIGLNLLFAALYSFQQNSIAGTTGGYWFYDCFFFSVQTLATVGYGHMYPQTLYGHIVTTIEIMSGIFLLAVMTGLIFVRFSRPTARVMFSNCMVIAPLNGKPTLMVRIGNENQHSMVEAEFRIMFSRDEPLLEGGDFRHFYVLKLHFDRLTVFPAALTLRHTIDETSPLFGATPELLESSHCGRRSNAKGLQLARCSIRTSLRRNLHRTRRRPAHCGLRPPSRYRTNGVRSSRERIRRFCHCRVRWVSRLLNLLVCVQSAPIL
jgi:inward rectifier potassium channel